MVSKRNSRIEVLRLISRFVAILGIVTISTLLLSSAVLAQGTTTTRPASKFAYFADQYGDYYHPFVAHVAAYTIDSVTGTLTEIPGSPFPAGEEPRFLWADPQGRFLYEADWLSEIVSVYAIDANTGVLTAIPSSPFLYRYFPDAMVGDPTGRFLYIGSEIAINVYTINPANGVLTHVGEPFYEGAMGLAVSPSGRFLYGASGNSIRAFAIDTDSGWLTEIAGSPFQIGASPSYVAIAPSGNFAYVAANYASGLVFAYAVNTSTGELTPVAGSPSEAGPSSYFVVVDPLGKFVYVANSLPNIGYGHPMTISGYAINQATGALTPIPGSPFPSGPGMGSNVDYGRGFTIDQSGSFLYVANHYGFAIDSLTGALTPLPGSPFGSGNDPVAVTTTGLSGPLIPTTTRLTSSLDQSVYGESGSLTVQVLSDAGTPTGTVQILSGSTVVGGGTLTAGSVSIPLSILPASTDPITAWYRGGGGFGPSKSAPLPQTVTKATSSTSLASLLNPAAAGQAVTFTATVISQYGGATGGTVTFTAGSLALGIAALIGNMASLTTSFSNSGTYAISAHYNGDSNNLASTSGTLSEKVIAATSVTLTSSLNPSAVGQAVTFTAAVASSSGVPPNGETITFYNGSSVLGTSALSGGIATITTSSLPAGIFSIKASYPGDSNFAASTSTGLRQVVNSTTKSATATTLTTSLNPSKYGQAVTFTAKVTTSGPVPPIGTVAFTWKYFTTSYTIGTATVNSSGIASLTKSNLNAGLFPLTAVYRGDASNLASTSPVVNQAVLQTTSSATVTSSLNPSTQGQSVTFTAKISSPTVLPTGPMTFTAGTTVLGSVQLSGGKASFTTSSLAAGSTVVKVTYNGNSNIKGSSAAVTQTVQP